MAREYRMTKRAAAHEKTREAIIRATMEVHDAKGVAPATFAEIAARAGVGQATVSRHFPTLGELVRACGAHVWMEMKPPTPDAAPAIFEGLGTTRERLTRLVEEIDAFYARGAHRLALAVRDRELVPELDGFLAAVEAGLDALVREALAGAGATERDAGTVAALMSFPVWQAMRRSGMDDADLKDFRIRLLDCSLKAARKA